MIARLFPPLIGLALLGASPAGAASIDAPRIARFDRFLNEAVALYRRAGAVPRTPVGRLGYAEAGLIDPHVVTSELTYVLERYASYRALLRQAPAQQRVPPVLPRPSGSTTPEQHVAGVDDGRADATGAIQTALAQGDVWLSPGHRYRVTRTISVPAHRRILSDGTGTILVAVGSPGFPATAFDMHHPNAGYSDVFQIHGVSDAQLRDFRLQTPIADADAPQPLLHGVDIRDAANVAVIGLELRGFARTRGIVRINSATDVLVADNLIHGSYTRALARQVTGIEVDETRSRAAVNGARGGSAGLRIAGNFVFGLLLDPSVYMDTSLRGGPPLSDETTGIQLAARESLPNSHVDDNVIADVGAGIDLFVNDAHFSGDVIVRTPEFGLKMGHGAMRNEFDGFRITASGIAAVMIYGSPAQPVGGNRITNLIVDHPGAVVALRSDQATTALALKLVADPDGTPATAASNNGNVFSHVRVTNLPPGHTPGWQGMGGCVWPAGSGPSSAPRDIFEDVVPAAELRADNGCGVIR